MTKSLPSAFRRTTACRALTSSALAIASALCLGACGGGHAATTTATTADQELHSAVTAPAATVLKHGGSLDVPRATLRTVGWQVTCVDGDKRVTAEAIRGQRTGSGRVISYASGSTSIWVVHNADGSLTISCR
jgi:hypothetical protein